MSPVPWTDSRQELGRRNEERVLFALSLPTRPEWIRGARAATGYEDKQGIDVVLDTDVGPLFVQVKSSRRGLESFRGKRRFGAGTRLACVVVRRGDNPGRVLSHLVHWLSAVREPLLEARAVAESLRWSGPE